MAVLERVECCNVRLFRWNENLFKNKKVSDSQGLALFVITTVLENSKSYGLPKNHRHECIVSFNLPDLFARDKNLGLKLVQATQQFSSSEDTCKTLGDSISGFLFTRFDFDDDPQAKIQPDSPKTVIVVEVSRSWFVLSDGTRRSKVAISRLLPPPTMIPPPRGTSEDGNEDKDDIADHEGVEKNSFLRCLRDCLGVRMGRQGRMGKSLTRDDPGRGGFVEISPAVVGRKRKWEDFDKSVDTCAICLEGFVGVVDEKISITSCSHVFHKNCILRWLMFNSNSCPTCRLVLPLGFNMMKMN